MKNLMTIFIIILLISCSTNNNKQISKLLPKDFNINHIAQNSIPSKIEIYTFDNHIINYNQIKDFPIEIKEDGWAFKKWHIANNKNELKYIIAMLDYLLLVDRYNYNYLELLKKIKLSLTNKKAYVSYYYRKKENLDYYKNGYIKFYCLQPDKQSIVYINFDDL